MSSSEVSVRLNPSFDDWYGARTVVEEELKIIGEALERIRISSRLQDAFTGHLLAVHRQWCKACPSAREHGGLPDGGLEEEAPAAEPIHTITRAAAAHNPAKQKTSRSYMSTFTQTTDIANGPQMNTQDEVDDSNDDIIRETSIPSSVTCCVEDEESLADVDRTLEKPSTEKVVSTKFIKLEVLEDDHFQEYMPLQLKLEKDHCDVDMDSSKEETPSQQIHEEEEPSQPIESGEQSHLERTNTVPDQRIKHERDSQGQHDLDMAGSSSEAMPYQEHMEEIQLDRSDGTNNSTLHCDVLGHGVVSTDQCTASMDSYKKVEETSRSEDTSKGVIASSTPKSPDTKGNSDSDDINLQDIKGIKRLKTVKRKMAILDDDEQSTPSTATPKHARHNDNPASALDSLDSLKIDALHDIATKMCELTESVNTFSQKLLNIEKSQQRQEKLLKYTSKVVHKLKPTEQIPNGVDGEFTNTADEGRSTDSREIMFEPLEHEVSSGKVEIASTYKIDLKEYSTAVHRAKRGKDDDERGRIFCLHIVKLLIPQDVLSTHNATGKTRNPMTKKWSSIPKLDDRLLAGVMEKAKHHFPNFSDSLHSKNSKTVYSINTLCKRARKGLSDRYQAEDNFDEFDEID